MNRQDIIEYCLKFPGAYEDYPFDGNWTVMRHSATHKSFAFIYEKDGNLCINLKCEPNKADFPRQIYKSVTPGYHMNKRHWNTITLGGDVAEPEVNDMIQSSYALITPKDRSASPT